MKDSITLNKTNTDWKPKSYTSKNRYYSFTCM